MTSNHCYLDRHALPAADAAPTDADLRKNPANILKPSRDVNIGRQRFADFDLAIRVFIVTRGAQGLGLALAEAIVEAGGKVCCFDPQDFPDASWDEACRRVVPKWGGSLHYRQQDVLDVDGLDKQITDIAKEHKRLDGVVAAASIQEITPAVDYTEQDASKLLSINYTGALMTATAAARQMLRCKCNGSIVLIASMSGLVANKGLISPVYNSSKAAVIQLAKNLAMERSPVQKDSTGGIRVNCISPGDIIAPMVEDTMKETPDLMETWESENMMGRHAETTEFKGAALYLLSNASSYVTASNVLIDGCHTAW